VIIVVGYTPLWIRIRIQIIPKNLIDYFLSPTPKCHPFQKFNVNSSITFRVIGVILLTDRHIHHQTNVLGTEVIKSASSCRAYTNALSNLSLLQQFTLNCFNFYSEMRAALQRGPCCLACKHVECSAAQIHVRHVRGLDTFSSCGWTLNWTLTWLRVKYVRCLCTSTHSRNEWKLKAARPICFFCRLPVFCVFSLHILMV